LSNGKSFFGRPIPSFSFEHEEILDFFKEPIPKFGIAYFRFKKFTAGM
jgi:hypothetical protein